jgi:hypothetical protein
MRRLLLRSGAVLALLALGTFGTTGGADALSLDGGTAFGTGTITPALTLAAQNTSVAFDGTAVQVVAAATAIPSAAAAAATCNVHVSGNGTDETVATGNGSGTLTCGGGTGYGASASQVPPVIAAGPDQQAIACGVTYHRDFVVIQVSGDCGPHGHLTALCVFFPTSNPPQSYELSCGFAFS